MPEDNESPIEELRNRIRASLKKVTDRGASLTVDQLIQMSSTEVQGESAIGVARALEALKTDTFLAATHLENKLDEHAKVLSDAARSSDLHAKRIARATWTLAALTAVLAMATIIMAFKTTGP